LASKCCKEFRIDKGYNPEFGTRPLRCSIGNLVEDPLSEMLLSGTFDTPCTIVVLAGAKSTEEMLEQDTAKPGSRCSGLFLRHRDGRPPSLEPMPIRGPSESLAIDRNILQNRLLR